ncbi:uncharacterized protein EV420DRAFT_1751041 [Desarmillaria tabescens]|uniref:Uncharacterized protein n=1 Tax=Armillaria tabescens TaxID=1929756 RepID=A0AA39JTW1_ARMTA|nr:uncharacterized protein EV420DRAFT_1751041 [Desarmillaria tabescens]KAK0447825.1 hypothetical protein EV420DRAFT_1751041 [Desarmillaria tabescens]
MTSSPTSSDTHLDGIDRPFYEAPFQNTITSGTGWDKTLRKILHSKYAMQYSSYKEIVSAYAEILELFEASNSNLVGSHYRSYLKQILSTAEIFVQYSKWYQEALPLGQLSNDIQQPVWNGRDISEFDANMRRQSKNMSSKIETEISLFRDLTGLEQRYKEFDNRRLLGFITRVSKIMAEISIAIFVCMTVLAVALPWHWKFIISEAVFALAIGAVPYLGFDVSKRMQRFGFAVQNLYMHYFLFIWGWNDLRAFLTYIAESDGPVSGLKVVSEFLRAFQNSFCGGEDELQLLQVRISASLAYGTKEDP